ncbi:MAG: N-acetylmuramoyl-L-alanine amidase [Acidobacteria bacterium]|nr:N-acetylmuramoyl-L-alanine amidase [Acidobacteriota bacterium]
MIPGPARALLLLPALLGAADPAPVELQARLPGGGNAAIRLAFRKGLQVETRRLPAAFLPQRREAWAAFEELSPEGKRWALKALFPEDRWTPEELRHQVRWPELESVWLLAALFTGHGQNYERLQAANPGNPEKLRKGDLWRVPSKLLSRELGGTGSAEPDRSQPEDELDDEARVAAYRSMLSFQKDAEGAYAAYRIRRGEALYSAVVMRFTERVSPREVNELAALLARRSGIPDLRAIPPGQVVKIPVEYLAGPFQPEGTRALAEEREMRQEIRRTARIDAGPRLKGVRVVLDAGHGGVDKGAAGAGAWESDFVYDIAMRVYRLLQESTDAQVSSTIRYPAVGFKSRDTIRGPSDAAEILTTPPFPNDGESPNAVSVHLRWVLANDLFRAFERKKGDPQKTVFLSFHADSLHPSARGAMVYVPGAPFVPARFSLGARRGAGVKEMGTGAQVALSPRQRIQGEARSRLLAESLLRSLRQARVAVHANRPIRNVIHREGRTFVPAVIRHSAASAKVLLEVLNLQNEEDVENLKDPAFRERYAEALVQGLQAFYRK